MECGFLLGRLSGAVDEIKCEALGLCFFLLCAAEEINKIFCFLRWLLLGLWFALRLTIFLLSGFRLGYLVTVVIARLGIDFALCFLLRLVNIISLIALWLFFLLFFVETPGTSSCLKTTWLRVVGVMNRLEGGLLLVGAVRALLELIRGHRLH